MEVTRALLAAMGERPLRGGEDVEEVYARLLSDPDWREDMLRTWILSDITNTLTFAEDYMKAGFFFAVIRELQRWLEAEGSRLEGDPTSPTASETRSGRTRPGSAPTA